MTTKEVLLNLHLNIHKSFSKLLDHCTTLSQEELDTKLEGFGYPTVRLQIHHMIGAEKYWIGVLEGRIDADEDEHLYKTLESLKAYREEIFAQTQNYLNKARADELVTEVTMTTWGGNKKKMKPLNVILRTQTHIYHHQGQILAMCRLMGKPGGSLDYPLE